MPRRPITVVAVLCTAVTFCLPLAAPAAFGRILVIHIGTLVDGVSDVPLKNVSIVVDDDKIIRIDSDVITIKGAENLDLADSTVMPFIDCGDEIKKRRR